MMVVEAVDKQPFAPVAVTVYVVVDVGLTKTLEDVPRLLLQL